MSDNFIRLEFWIPGHPPAIAGLFRSESKARAFIVRMEGICPGREYRLVPVRYRHKESAPDWRKQRR